MVARSDLRISRSKLGTLVVALCAAVAFDAGARTTAWRPSVGPSLPGQIVDIVAGNYYLQAPDTIPAGLTTLRLRVQQGAHIAVLVRLDSGHTAIDLLRSRREGHSRPAWMHFLGGPGFPAPGKTANSTLMLTPGNYLLLCDVADRDGVHHFEKGMFHAIVVRPADMRAEARMPKTDATVTMRDYSFAFTPPLHAGNRLLRIVNRGSVMHEFRLVHVLPGHTGQESMTWTPGSKSARPDEDVTAIVGLLPGAELMTTVPLVAGEYVAFCVPELSHHMIQIVRVLPATAR